MRRLAPATLLVVAVAALVGAARQGPMQEWPIHGGDPGGAKASPLADINRANVTTLGVAWEWRPGDAPLDEFGTRPGNFQNTPLMIDNVLYVSTQYSRVVALDAETAASVLYQVGRDHAARGNRSRSGGRRAARARSSHAPTPPASRPGRRESCPGCPAGAPGRGSPPRGRAS